MNVVLIVIESLRTDHLGAYGYFRGTSACLDDLAREGVVFDFFHSQSTHTAEACASIITGKSPLYSNETPLAKENDPQSTIAEAFRANGKVTCCVDGLFSLPSHPCLFHRGYQCVVDPTPIPGRPHHVGAEAVTQQALRWLEHHRDSPFFLFLHYWDPHPPFNQPPAFKTLFDHSRDELTARAVEAPSGQIWVPHAGALERLTAEMLERIDRYDGEIAYVDAEVSRLLGGMKDLGIYNDSCVVITSSHGMDLLEHHDPFSHSETYQETLQVPLIMKPSATQSDWPRGGRVSQPATHRDLFPTLLSAEGIDPSEILPSEETWDLQPFIEGIRQEQNRVLLSAGSYVETPEVWGFREISLSTSKHKLIARKQELSSEASWELYDLEVDPMETNDLSEVDPDTLEEMKKEFASRAPRSAFSMNPI